MSPQQRANFIICLIASMKTLAARISKEGLDGESLSWLSDVLKEGGEADRRLAEKLIAEYQQLRDIVSCL